MNEYMNIVEGKENAKIIYEDDIALAFLPKRASTQGEVVIIPKKPYQIMEQLPEDEMGHMAILARKISDICFEILSGQGTNILIQNGIPAGQDSQQFSIRIFPRRSDDGLDFKLQGEKEDDKELESIKNIIYNETKNIFISSMKTRHKEIEEKPKPKEIVHKEEGEIDYDYRLDFLKNKHL